MSEPLPPQPKRPRGRPTKFTDDLADALCVSAREGCTPRTAAELNGIDPERLDAWLKAHSDFRNAFRLARAQARHEAVKVIQGKIERGDADAAWRFLGKMEPETYGDKQRHEVSGPDGGPVPVSYVEVIAVAPIVTDTDQ